MKKNREKEEKSRRIGKNWEGSFTLPLADRAGYATEKGVNYFWQSVDAMKEGKFL